MIKMDEIKYFDVLAPKQILYDKVKQRKNSVLCLQICKSGYLQKLQIIVFSKSFQIATNVNISEFM